MKFIVKKEKRMPKLKNPILIEGLPGIGNVARIAVDFLIDKLNAKKYMTIYSYSFPNSVFVLSDGLVELPKVELFYWKNKKRKNDLILLVGDFQPSDEEKSYLLIEKILTLLKKDKISKIITLGGIGLSEEPKKSKVHIVATSKKFIKELEKCGAICDGDRTVRIVVGAAGLLLGLGKLMGIEGFSLLGETYSHPAHLGIRASKEILKVLTKYLKIDVPIKDLEDEIKSIEKEISMRKKKIAKELEKEIRRYEVSKDVSSYIG